MSGLLQLTQCTMQDISLVSGLLQLTQCTMQDISLVSGLLQLTQCTSECLVCGKDSDDILVSEHVCPVNIVLPRPAILLFRRENFYCHVITSPATQPHLTKPALSWGGREEGGRYKNTILHQTKRTTVNQKSVMQTAYRFDPPS